MAISVSRSPLTSTCPSNQDPGVHNFLIDSQYVHGKCPHSSVAILYCIHVWDYFFSSFCFGLQLPVVIRSSYFTRKVPFSSSSISRDPPSASQC